MPENPFAESDFAAKIEPKKSPVDFVYGVVTDTAADGTVTVELEDSGVAIPGVAVMSHYSPTVNDTIRAIIQRDQMVVLGANFTGDRTDGAKWYRGIKGAIGTGVVNYTSTTLVDWNGTNSTVSDLSIVKKYANSDLLVSISGTAYRTGASAENLFWGAKVVGFSYIGGTNFLHFNQASVHHCLTSFVLINNVTSTGTMTIRIGIRTGSGIQLSTDTNDTVGYTVEEVF